MEDLAKSKESVVTVSCLDRSMTGKFLLTANYIKQRIVRFLSGLMFCIFRFKNEEWYFMVIDVTRE